MDWMIYGANGYTGRMMVEEAVKRGLRPVLAGRSAASLEPLAKKHGLPVRAFALDNEQALRWMAASFLDAHRGGLLRVSPEEHQRPHVGNCPRHREPRGRHSPG